MVRGFRAGIGVKAAVFHSGRILLLRRSWNAPQYRGLWDLPGGAVEKDESLEDALLREAWEETALRLKVGRAYHAVLTMWPAGDGTSFPSVGIFFLCRRLGRGEPRLRPNEHSEYAWVDRRALHRYRMPSFWAKAVRLAFDQSR